MSKLEELQKHTLHLFQGDYHRLQIAYPNEGAALIIRTLVRAHLTKIDPPVDTSKIRSNVDV
jgi:hypothetical protein